MLRRKNIAFSFLVIFHLLVFTTAYTVKIVHHHPEGKQNIAAAFQTGKTVFSTHHPCPICQFEFVNFLAKNLTQYFYNNFYIRLVNFNQIRQYVQAEFSCFAHRAPPLS
ncbi:MAG: hypothetical protein Q8907_14325 [Bacteroidota bacterium]|nr:hypothetical protein [Bacteroidota bacterium]